MSTDTNDEKRILENALSVPKGAIDTNLQKLQEAQLAQLERANKRDAKSCANAIGKEITIEPGKGRRITGVITSCRVVGKRFEVHILQSGKYAFGPYCVRVVPK